MSIAASERVCPGANSIRAETCLPCHRPFTLFALAQMAFHALKDWQGVTEGTAQ